MFETLREGDLPEWFRAPEGSLLRGSIEQWGGTPWVEDRSMQGSARDVLAHYVDCCRRGGLTMRGEPEVGRAAAGFVAGNDEYHFSIDVLADNGLCFWTIQLGIRNAPQAAPVAVEAEDPTAAPIVWPTPRTERIEWARLPEWVQFGIPRGTEGELYVDVEGDGRVCRAWVMFEVPGTSPRALLESCLRRLDEYGFDASGAQRPEHSYYLSALQLGHSVTVQVVSEAGERAMVCVLNTLGHVSLNVNYTGPSPLKAHSSRHCASST